MKFVSVPTEIAAERWDGTPESFDAIAGMGATLYVDPELRLLCGVDGAQGWVPVPIGHWVVKGAPQDFYPIEDEVLRRKYRPA